MPKVLLIWSGIVCFALACDSRDVVCLPSTAVPPNLLLLTIDTLRADHVSSNGYARETTPNLDALASRGVRFSSHTVQQSSTWPSLTSIMTSRYPHQHGVVANGMKPNGRQVMLADLLRSAGFDTGAFVANMMAADHPGFDTVERFDGPERDRQATDAAIAWLREHRGERFFLWLHLLGPHEPYDPSPRYRDLFPTEYQGPLDGDVSTLRRILKEKIALTPNELDHIISLYDGDLAQADAQIGLVLEALHSLDLDSSTLVVASSDHGELLYDRQFFFQHSKAIHSGVLNAPLVMALPGALERKSVVSEVVESIDVAPTLLDLLGVAIPPTMQGRSLRTLVCESPAGSERREASVRILGDDPAAFAFLDGAIRAIRTEHWLYIHNDQPARPLHFPIAQRELYDLIADPTNRSNVVEDHPAVVARLEQRLDAWWKQSSGHSSTPRAASKFDPKTEAELRALGYLED